MSSTDLTPDRPLRSRLQLDLDPATWEAIDKARAACMPRLTRSGWVREQIRRGLVLAGEP